MDANSLLAIGTLIVAGALIVLAIFVAFRAIFGPWRGLNNPIALVAFTLGLYFAALDRIGVAVLRLEGLDPLVVHHGSFLLWMIVYMRFAAGVLLWTSVGLGLYHYIRRP